MGMKPSPSSCCLAQVELQWRHLAGLMAFVGLTSSASFPQQTHTCECLP